MKSLEGSYDFAQIEKKMQKKWQEDGVYSWDENETRENSFVIDTPPPTVSGQLHMGHLFSYTQTDFIARFQRMMGKNIFYPMGFDDNGLPTERLVEKQKNIRAVNTDREEFIKLCFEVIEPEEKKFKDLFDSMALSVDWDLKYQSISTSSTQISQMSFLDLINKDEIYRAEQPVLWDPIDQTALAQADIEDKEKNSEMHEIAFKDDSGNNLMIATSRPELLPACVALFYNPEDPRYTHLKDKFALSPLFNESVPILPDSTVAIDKGTGLVMCCTFGDTTDILWWQTHKLPLKIILDRSGRIKESEKFKSEEANTIFASLIGCKINEARTKILEILRSRGLVFKSYPITHTVKCAERSGAPLEIITAPQWFVKTIKHKDDLLKRSSQLNWYPKSMKIKLDSWINSISWDWCISRQRFFGVPFPVWYSKRVGEEGMPIFAKPEQLPVNPLIDLPNGYSREEVQADTDVMDTWATSAVSPQLSSLAISSGYAIDIARHKKLFPFDLRPQAHEILRTWAFYTILKSHLHENTLPWKNIMVSGWCLAEDKTKMSKSKGNIISPVDLIKTYGSDAVRYWASTSRLGADTAFSEDLLKIGKKLTNKIWNAAKFASSHFESVKNERLDILNLISSKTIYHTTDLWLISKLQKTIRNATNSLNNFEYAEGIEHIENFFWKDFCDNYLEISKSRCYNEDSSDLPGKLSATYTLYYSLENILKLFAPYMPHITDEIYSLIYNNSESIHKKANWPKCYDELINEESCKIISNAVNILDLVRKAKSSKNLSMKAEIKKIIHNKQLDIDALSDLRRVTNTLEILFSEEASSCERFEDERNNVIYIEF